MAEYIEREALIEKINREIERSSSTRYICDDGTEIVTDVGYVEDWFRKYADVMRKAPAAAGEFKYGSYEDEPLEDPFFEAFDSIAGYNGHIEWLKELSEKLKNYNEEEEEGYFNEGVDIEEWHTEKHVLWMMLVAAFGDWGTSIRSGWISNAKEAARFIDKVTEED